MDYIIMFFIFIFLAFLLLYKTRRMDSSDHFFNLDNTKAMRGFWCLVIILVHTPPAYENLIQKLIGCFAYIGVTFFFMTSSYGLTLSSQKRPGSLSHFWKKRLPKLLITGWVVNLLISAVYSIAGCARLTVFQIVMLNGWVIWLLGCYFIFWITHILLGEQSSAANISSVCLIAFCSVLIYFLQSSGIIPFVTWAPECFGFIWGILLAVFCYRFITFMNQGWFKKVVFLCIAASILGVCYLKYKTVFFFGDYLLKIILGVAITLIILSVNVKYSLGNKISLYLGEISFEVYLSHSFIFEMMAVLCPRMSSGLYILLTMIITVILSTVAHLITRKILVWLRPFLS